MIKFSASALGESVSVPLAQEVSLRPFYGIVFFFIRKRFGIC